MKNVDKLIEDFAKGRINTSTLQTKLNNDMQSINRNQDAKQERLIKKISQNYSVARSPEDIICEEEKLADIISILTKLKQKMPNDLWWIMVQVAVNHKTQTEIAEKLNVSQSTVYRKIKRAIGLASRIITVKEYNECFIVLSKLEANSASIKIKYPADSFSKSPCKLHEYLDKSFGDCKTICGGYCGKQCSNKIIKGRIFNRSNN